MNGIFITFEGPDGAGKTTQIEQLHVYLLSLGLPVLATREPGGTRISDHIRQLILNPEFNEMAEETEILLYAASRAQHVREKIRPALEQGSIVLCDRYLDASIAYQGYGHGFGEEVIWRANKVAVGDIYPYRTYLIDVSPEVGLRRLGARKNHEFGQELDRIEQKEIEYHQRVRNGFQALAQQYKDRIVTIDGEQPAQSIQAIIRQDLMKILTQQGFLT